MTSSFNAKPNTAAAPATSAPMGANPFSGANAVSDLAPLFPAGVTARVRVENFRVVPPQLGSQLGLAVYIDTTILEVFEGAGPMIALGKKITHRIAGFNGTGAVFAHRELKAFELAALASDGLTAESEVDFEALPLQVEAEGLAKGKEIYIKTESKSGRSGKAKVTAAFQPV